MKIELRNVSLTYVGSPLLRDVSLVVLPGQFVLIEGPSGSGKSSLLRLLNRLQEPTDGTILVDDRPAREHEVMRLRRRIGYVQQTPVMLDGNVAANLGLPFRFRATGHHAAPTSARLRTLLDEFLLHDVSLDDDATRLSVGQKQRVALIRTLLTEPQVLLCDEPTSALDPQSREIVQAALERLNIEHAMSIILVTHLDYHPKHAAVRRYRLAREDGLREVDG